MRFYSNPVPIPVGGSQWSKIFFLFSDEWEDLRKIAQFRQGELKRNVDIDSNNFCYVPNEMLPDMCGELSIVGYPQDTASAIIATANSLMLNFVQGFESGGEPAVPPTPDLYQKLLKEFAESGGGNPDAVLYSKQELTDKQQKQARTNIGAEKVGTGYSKPASGIPKTDLEQSVQTSLDKADTAISLGLTAATPGQIIKVKAVQDGKPTAWEAVDMPSGEEWEKIKEITIAEDAGEANALTINADENGNTFRLKKARLCAKFPAYTGTSSIPNFSFAMINGKTTGRIAPLMYTSVWPKISTKSITGTVYYVDVSGAQQIEHVQVNGNSAWSDDTSHDYRTYGSNNDQLKTIYGDTLWAKPITSIGGVGMLIYPGCHFVLYGVRA